MRLQTTAVAEGESHFTPTIVEPEVELGHVLFIDVVGYSRLLNHEQHECLQTLNRIVRSTEAFQAAELAGKLTRLPTGDGMALVFTSSPDAPVRCAVQVSAELRAPPEFRVRMGIHSGPVSGITDVNDGANFAGAGINLAQRVMDCGDGGHILVSRRVAEDLGQYRQWKESLHDLGEFEVKHGLTIGIVNLYTAEVGNPALPAKFGSGRDNGNRSTARQHFAVKAACVAVAAGSLLAVAAWFGLFTPGVRTDNSDHAVAPRMTRPIGKSIAVLPFENLSANQETAFFTEGVQDEILTNLSKVADLKVISRTSVMQYKTPRARNLRDIGQQLGVAHILEGSVQRIGDRVRVNVQLIDARTDAHVWAQVYDRELADVFAIQTEISKTIADQLQARLSPREQAAIAQPATVDIVAERLFVEAWQQVELASNPDAKDALLRAVALCEEALARDPHFLRAYGLLVTAQIDLYWQGFDHTQARLDAVRAVLDQAARLYPDAGEVHLARADYMYKGFRNYDGARAELELARASLPNNPLIYIYTAAMDRRQGRWAESIRNWERGVELDPRNFRYLMETAFTNEAVRHLSESARLYQRALSVLPGDEFARTQLAELAFFERADVGPWKAELAAIVSEDPGKAPEIANGLFYCALAERDPAALARALGSIRAEGLRDTYNNSLWTRDWFVGLAARTTGDAAKATAAFTAAREVEQQTVLDQPDYAPAWSRLGLIDAGLGRKEDAIREGRRACELLPVSRDAIDGPSYITNLAIIYAWVGEKDQALEQLGRAAELPGGVKFGEVKLYPQWDPLRGDPRFEAIVASLAPKP